MNKTLLSGMFSSISDAELITNIFPVTTDTNHNENQDFSDENTIIEVQKESY